MHIWDVDKAEKAGAASRAEEVLLTSKSFLIPCRKWDIPVCSLEYTKDMTDVLPGVAESIGYFNGVLSL